MVSLRSITVGIFLSSSLVFGGVVQKPDLALPDKYQGNRDAVVNIFTTSYQAYKCVLTCFKPPNTKLAKRDHALRHDNLLPLSQGALCVAL